jgi:hypothetical protein
MGNFSLFFLSKEGEMTGFLERPSVSAVRRVGRILGTLLGLLVLALFLEWVTGPSPPAAIRDYLGAVGLVMIVLGFVVGWFKELVAFLLALGGTALASVVWLLSPRADRGPWPIFLVTAIISFLFYLTNLDKEGMKGIQQ